MQHIPVHTLFNCTHPYKQLKMVKPDFYGVMSLTKLPKGTTINLTKCAFTGL